MPGAKFVHTSESNVIKKVTQKQFDCHCHTCRRQFHFLLFFVALVCSNRNRRFSDGAHLTKGADILGGRCSTG